MGLTVLTFENCLARIERSRCEPSEGPLTFFFRAEEVQRFSFVKALPLMAWCHRDIPVPEPSEGLAFFSVRKEALQIQSV